MPNNCINEIIFRGVSAAQQKEIVRLACNAEGQVDFEILVPMPANVWRGNVGVRHEQAFGTCGLDWAKANWGTKWNAYGHHPVESGADHLILRFETAWRPPYTWLVALFNTTKLGFEHNWLSEGGNRGVCGVFDWSALESDDPAASAWSQSDAPEAMHRHLHKLLWGVEAFEDREGEDA